MVPQREEEEHVVLHCLLSPHTCRTVDSNITQRMKGHGMEIGPVWRHGEAVRRISPTDVAQFIRLDQCQRYLRLRLYERNVQSGFMRDYDVTPQSIPPILTQSGADFERRVEDAVAERFPSYKMSDGGRPRGSDESDNDLALQHARSLHPGETVILFQPRLRATLDGWQINGDVDILRMERDGDGALHTLIVDNDVVPSR